MNVAMVVDFVTIVVVKHDCVADEAKTVVDWREVSKAADLKIDVALTVAIAEKTHWHYCFC